MRGGAWVLIAILLFIVSSTQTVFAEPTYVLPYPSEMPGSRLYKAFVLWDELMKYWYFGSLSQFRYNLEQSDKYLVEAKTLFEYKQYLLAENALKKSDIYFNNAQGSLEIAKVEQKNIRDKKSLFKEAARKHIEVLEAVKAQVPEAFVWQPEKTQASILDIGNDISNAIMIRQSCL